MLISMYQAGKLNLDDTVTREYTLEQINDGYRDMLEGRNIRGIIRYTNAGRLSRRSGGRVETHAKR